MEKPRKSKVIIDEITLFNSIVTSFNQTEHVIKGAEDILFSSHNVEDIMSHGKSIAIIMLNLEAVDSVSITFIEIYLTAFGKSDDYEELLARYNLLKSSFEDIKKVFEEVKISYNNISQLNHLLYKLGDIKPV